MAPFFSSMRRGDYFSDYRRQKCRRFFVPIFKGGGAYEGILQKRCAKRMTISPEREIRRGLMRIRIWRYFAG